jgi:hypothetical protein
MSSQLDLAHAPRSEGFAERVIAQDPVSGATRSVLGCVAMWTGCLSGGVIEGR